jgi:hypothetical protein
VQGGVLRTLEVGAALPFGAEMEVATAVDAASATRAIVDRIASI